MLIQHITLIGMEEDIFNPYSLFKIPQMETEGKIRRLVCGLIDASGSMGSYWAALAKFWNQSIASSADFLITFSQKAKIEQKNELSLNLKDHGGGMTNILEAFEKLEIRLDTVPNNIPVTVVFISDGQDTVNGDTKVLQKMMKLKGGRGRDLTFLCLGIQSGFPTKMAMLLRELYHTGQENIPAVYLIEYASEKAFFNKFQTMRASFKTSNLIQIPNARGLIKQYPWDQDGTGDFKEGKFVMVHKEFPKIQIVYNGTIKNQFEVGSLKGFSIDQLVDCFRGWVQKVQLISMDNKKLKEAQDIAKKALQAIKNYTMEYQKIHAISILTQKPVKTKQSFKDRAIALTIKNTGSRILWFIEELTVISKGVGLGQLNQYDAAKRIGIGTIVGKYHQKALALKGITPEDFKVIKEEFIKVFRDTKLSKTPSKQEESIFTLQNQKEVFEEVDLCQGLQFCKSQYDLVETFPVVGYSLKVKRYDGSLINPWKLRVLQLAKTHKSIDSVCLAKNNNKYVLSIGQDETEEINAVLPLFGLQDGDMSPLLNTRLFKLAVSFMAVQNIDTYHDEAYLALLATTYTFLLGQPVSQWRDKLIQQIYSSIKVTYGATTEFQEFVLKVQENPFHLYKKKEKKAIVKKKKVLLLTNNITKEGRLQKKKINHLIDLTLVHYAQKTYVQNEKKIFKVADLMMEEIKPNAYKAKKEDMGEKNYIKNHDHLKQEVDKKLGQSLSEDHIKIKLSEKIFLHEEEDKRVTYKHIAAFYSQLTGSELAKMEILYYFAHYLQGKDTVNYNKPVVKNLQHTQKVVISHLDLSLMKSGKEIKKLRKQIENQYIEQFKNTHFGIMPLKQSQLKDLCIQLKTDYSKYNYNESSSMVRNACMSPQCLYYMQPTSVKELVDHMRLWKHRLPARFHQIVMNRLKSKKSPEEICKELVSTKKVDIKRHEKPEEYVLDYIKKIEAHFK